MGVGQVAAFFGAFGSYRTVVRFASGDADTALWLRGLGAVWPCVGLLGIVWAVVAI